MRSHAQELLGDKKYGGGDNKIRKKGDDGVEIIVFLAESDLGLGRDVYRVTVASVS